MTPVIRVDNNPPHQIRKSVKWSGTLWCVFVLAAGFTNMAVGVGFQFPAVMRLFVSDQAIDDMVEILDYIARLREAAPCWERV